VLVVVAPHYLVSEQVVELAHRRTRVDVRTVRATRLVIRVVDDRSEPISGAEVYFAHRAEPAVTDSGGRLVINGISRGLHTVGVHAAGYLPREITVLARDREVPIGLPSVPHVRVDLSATPALVSSLGDRPLVDVRLVAPGDPSGSIYSDERVAAAELAPDGSGRAVVEKVPPGEYTVWVSWRGGLVHGPNIRVSDETPVAVRVHLAAEGWLTGAIRERVDGRLRGVRWYPDLSLMDETRSIGTRALVENGRYSFTVLPAGRWRLVSDRSRRIDIRPGENRRDLIVPAERRR
jgi:hypothetical protein